MSIWNKLKCHSLPSCYFNFRLFHSTHLWATVDGLPKEDMSVLGAPVPVLALDADRLGVDAGLTGWEVAVGLNSVGDAALIGIDPVKS